MDQMLPSPSFNIPSIGTPHHGMEEDQMIDRSAMAKQEQSKSQDYHGKFYNSSGMTPHNLLSSGQTPHSLLASPAVHNQGKSLEPTSSHVYAPVASPAPPSPMPPSASMSHLSTNLASAASMEPGIVPQLQNIVSTVSLGCPLDLKKIALHARNAEYNPKRFAAVIMRIRDPRTTALIFSSGKMVCTGAKSEEDSRLAARKYARIIQKLGFPAKFKEFKIQNMVGSCDVKFPIRLEGLMLTHSQFSSYEPELFPGLIYRMVKPRIVLLIFVSGKVVLTGAKERQDIHEAFDNIHPILKNFKKQ